MILGVGIDVTEIARIEQASRRPQFLARCFTERERAYAGGGEQAAHRFAARFAAKEATFKALGVGAAKAHWQEAEVVRLARGVTVVLSGSLEERLRALGGSRLHLSFSHGKEVAVAVVVVEA